MSTYAEKIAALEAAAATGILTVEANGERVTYASVDQMLRAIAYLKQQQAAAASTTRTSTTLATFSRE